MSRVKEITSIWTGLLWQLWKPEWAWLKRTRCKNPSLLHSVYTPSSFPPTPLPQSEHCFGARRASAVMIPEVLQTSGCHSRCTGSDAMALGSPVWQRLAGPESWATAWRRKWYNLKGWESVPLSLGEGTLPNFNRRKPVDKFSLPLPQRLLWQAVAPMSSPMMSYETRQSSGSLCEAVARLETHSLYLPPSLPCSTFLLSPQ